MQDQNCIFCKIISGQIQSKIIKDTQDILVIQDISPKAPIHYLIIPKIHVQDVQSIKPEDSWIAQRTFEIAKELSKENLEAKDFKLILNSGYGAGQRVFHIHTHFLAGRLQGEV